MQQFLAILSVILVSLVSLVGVVILFFKKEKLDNILLILVSFSVGALLGDAFIHLLPEAFEDMGAGTNLSLLVLAGILTFFVLEKFLRWHHCHDSECDMHAKHLATMNLVGDGVHNFIDGLLIGGSYLVSIPIGVSTTIAVVLHEIPQEIGDCGVLLHSGLKMKKALLYNFYSALFAVLGTVISLAIGSKVDGFASLLLPFTAGGFIYIAGSDLIPELHNETKISMSIKQLAAIIFGIAIMIAMLRLE